MGYSPWVTKSWTELRDFTFTVTLQWFSGKKFVLLFGKNQELKDVYFTAGE